MQTDNRPLSPHLQIYRWQWTMASSIMHRATGIILAGAALFLVYWLVAVAGGAGAYAQAQSLFGSALGKVVMVICSYAFFYHLCNGVRHLFWDAGRGFELGTAQATARAVVVVSVLLTVLLWIVAFTA